MVRGKAIYAGGVQFPPVHFSSQTFLPSQASNLYIFPAVGLAIPRYERDARHRCNVHRGRANARVSEQVIAAPGQRAGGQMFGSAFAAQE